MNDSYNVYCDESCHLENDRHSIMVLGAVWCPQSKRLEISQRLREIKAKHGMKLGFEAKWNKVSPSKQSLYQEIIDYFFDDDDLHFRGLVVSNKDSLNHSKFAQDHDLFYYKMQFDLLKVLISPGSSYNIYLDIKDTRSQSKVSKLHEVICNSQYDFNRQLIAKVQQVRSHEVEIMQLTDLLTGALSYLHRNLQTNSAKLLLIDRIKKRSRYSLLHTTLYKETKVNIFIWTPHA